MTLGRRTPPSGLMRLALRLPILLYRLHLGWLLGDRFLLLTHTGRKSKLSRQTVVEVVDHDLSDDSYYIASGWGESADWYRNIQVTPQVTVQTGRRNVSMLAKRVGAERAADIFRRYAEVHPRAFGELGRFMLGKRLSNSESDLQLLAAQIPLIKLSLVVG